MKNFNWLLFAVTALSVVFASQAQNPSYDECAYPSGMPANQKLTFAGYHTIASFVDTTGTNTTTCVFDSFGWGSTNNANPACDSSEIPYLTYSCDSYSGSWLASDLEAYLNGTIVLYPDPVAVFPDPTIGVESVTENHTGTGFNVSVTTFNSYFLPSGGMVTDIYNISSELIDGYVTSSDCNQGGDHGGTNGCCHCYGMPKWFITEPYLNLWVKDTPVFYTTSLGEEIDFTVAYKQHDTRPLDTTVPPTGWSHNWFSYVHFVVPTYLSSTNSAGPGVLMPGSTGPVIIKSGWLFTNDFSKWQAILYATDNGENYFDYGSRTESKSGLTLIPADGGSTNGFKLVHPDGSVDEYQFVSSPTFSFGLAKNHGGVHDMGFKAAKLVSFGPIAYYDTGTNNYVEDSNAQNSAPPIGQKVGYVACDALLTKRTDPYGNAVLLFYNSSTNYYLQSIVDYDGKTTTLSYDSQGMLTNVSMPYGRSASFTYTDGQMTHITDAQGISSSFSYDNFAYNDLTSMGTNAYLSSLTTPYGTTTFSNFEASAVMAITNPPSKHRHVETGGSVSEAVEYGGSVTPVYVGRYGRTTNGVNKACTVTYPDNTHELYIYRYDSANLVPANYPTDVIPFGDDGIDHGYDDPNLIDHLLSTRNSFHWNRQQYALLSTTSIQNLTSNDYAAGTMKHWLETDSTQSYYPQAPEYNVSDQASLIREASPDGVREGVKTWISYDNQSGWRVSGNEGQSIAATILPDGSIRRITTTYYEGIAGLLSSIADTYTTQWGTESTRWSGYDYDHIDVYDGSENYTYYRLYKIYDPFRRITLTYPAGDSEMDATDSGGGTSSYFYNSRHQVTGIKHANGLTTTNIYGGDGFLMKSIDIEANATNLYSFANGLPNSSSSPLGLQLNYSWDNLSRLKMVSFPDGTTVSNNYYRLDLVDQKDRLNHWIHASYDAFDQPSSSTDANGNVTCYSFCYCGALGSITDPLGNSTVFARDYNGNVTQTGSIDGFSINYNRNIIGQATNITTSAGLNLNYFYNNQGLVTSVTSPAGTVFAVAYDADDRPVYITDAQGVSITNAYDAQGRLTYRWDAFSLHEENDYSPQGVYRHYDSFRWLTTYGYDSAGRLAAMTDANDNTNGFTYNPAGQIATLADGNGHVTSWAYDIYGHNTSKTNGNGVLVETNGYDADGRLTAHWTPAKGLTHYTYDANGNPLTAAYSSGTGITATYDELNRIVSMSDAAGSSAFTHQNFGAFQGALATEDGPWASDTVTYVYANRLPQSLTLAQPSGNWSEGYGYDGLLRLHTLTSAAGTFTYTYNGVGRQIQNLSLPGSGNNIANTYDAVGQLLTTALTHGSTVFDSEAYVYYHNGNRTSVTRADGAYVNYGYDYVGQLTSAAGHEAGGLLRGNENFGYGYDPAGNLASRQNNTLIQSFTTDNANALVNITRNNDVLTVAGVLNGHPTNLTVNGASATIYNDMTFAVPGGITIGDGNNVLTAQTVNNGVTTTSSLNEFLPVSVNLTCDLNGNLTSDGLHGYGYDCANELTSETVTNGWRNEFVYDGFGRRRVRKEYAWSGGAWAETNEVHYVYDGMNVIQERDGSNNPKVSYTRGLDFSGTMAGAGGIGGLLARTDSSGSAFYHADGNGNITMLVNSSGAVLAKYLYDPYGNTLGMWGAKAPVNTYRFSSKEIDVKSGLYYYGYRYYEPNLQRWLNQDPIEEMGGINLYRFVGNNPISFVDPYGLAIGDWWDARTYFNSGFTEGWSDAANSLGQSFGGSLAAGYDTATFNSGLVNGDLNYAASGQDLSQYSYDALRGLDPTGLLPADPCDKNANAGMYLGMVGGLFTGGTELQFGKDANALIQLAKDAKRTGVSPEDAETLLQWAKEYKVNPARGPEIHPNRNFNVPHIQIGPVNHIPINP